MMDQKRQSWFLAITKVKGVRFLENSSRELSHARLRVAKSLVWVKEFLMKRPVHLIVITLLAAQGSFAADYDQLVERGREACQKEDYFEAKRCFHKAMALLEASGAEDPRMNKARENIAWLNVKQKNYTEALEMYTELSKRGIQRNLAFAEIYEAIGKPMEAVGYYEKEIRAESFNSVSRTPGPDLAAEQRIKELMEKCVPLLKKANKPKEAEKMSADAKAQEEKINKVKATLKTQ
jgi:tetratricopeptide (TPR) repeat protein